LLGSWRLRKDGETDNGSGELIDRHGHPPTEGPALGQ
jgi:hypothetical protein